MEQAWFKVKKKLIIFFISAIFCILIFPNFIYPDEIDYPDYIGYVNDFASILDASAESELGNMITDLEQDTSAEIAVVTIENLQGITIEEYAVVLFEKWGIGKQDLDNGLLFLVAVEEREIRIEVGYGLEGVITDIEAGNIINDIMVPQFKNGEFGEGLYDAVVIASGQIYGEADYESLSPIESAPPAGRSFPFGTPYAFICCFFVPLLIILIILLTFLFRHRCPKCRRFFALKIKSTTLKSPSYTAQGKKLVERTCKYCSFHDKKEVVLPRKTRRSSGFSSGSGGFSGGGFSSGGSFGGGSSGGGGASGGW
jgi:uncharacterized protein